MWQEKEGIWKRPVVMVGEKKVMCPQMEEGKHLTCFKLPQPTLSPFTNWKQRSHQWQVQYGNTQGTADWSTLTSVLGSANQLSSSGLLLLGTERNKSVPRGGINYEMYTSQEHLKSPSLHLGCSKKEWKQGERNQEIGREYWIHSNPCWWDPVI